MDLLRALHATEYDIPKASAFGCCFKAARGGHLEVLKWARTQGFEWNDWTCVYAAKGGHLEVIKWAHANGLEMDARRCLLFAREESVKQWLRTTYLAELAISIGSNY